MHCFIQPVGVFTLEWLTYCKNFDFGPDINKDLFVALDFVCSQLPVAKCLPSTQTCIMLPVKLLGT